MIRPVPAAARQGVTAAGASLSRAWRKGVREVAFYAAVLLVLGVVLVPYLWMVSGSFKTTLELQSADVTRPGLEPRWIPRTFTWENYARVNRTVPMLDYFRNSLIISTGTMLAATTVAFLAAYGLSRFPFPGRRAFVGSVLATQMLPGIVFLIPYFILFTWIDLHLGIRLRNTYPGLIFTYTSFALPFAILMLRGYLDAIPTELDEQARLDGCSTLATLVRVILPVARPALAAVAIYAFIMAWNEILFASVLTGTETRTVAVGLREYITAQEARWSGMMAACVVVTLPVVVLFSLIQRQIVEGLVTGAVRG